MSNPADSTPVLSDPVLSDPVLAALIANTEAQLHQALTGLAAGELVDLVDLLPRMEAVCTQAVASRDAKAAQRLAVLIGLLDQLEAQLQARIRQNTAPPPDPRRAANSYRAAAPVTPPAPGEE